MATILIVDDDRPNRDYLAIVLRHHRHHVLEAADGREGLATAQREHPDIVITDVLMPVMDGYEMVKQLKLDPNTAGIPIIFHTGHYGEERAAALALSSGVAHVMRKPVKSTEVLKVVARILAGELEMQEPPGIALSPAEFDRAHLRLISDKLSEKVADLNAANARLRALIEIGANLTSDGDSDRRLNGLCSSARDLFGVTFITVGVVDRNDLTVQRVVYCGPEVAPRIEAGEPAPGILGRVVAERRTFRGVNPRGDPDALALPLSHPGIQAFLVAPIASSAHAYGWMCLVDNSGREFSEDDEHLVLVLAGQVGRIYELEREILEREAAEEEMRHHAELSALAAAIGLALITDSLVGSLQQCAEALVTHLGVAFARIWTLNEREAVLELQASAGLYTHLHGPHGRIPVGKFKIGRIALDRKPHLTNSVIGDPEVSDQEWAQREGMVAFAGHPLIVDGRVVGVMALFARHTLSDAVISALASVADHMALGIERQRGAEALRTAEERMRFAMDAAGVGVWDMDYATGVLRWSEIQEAQYGLRRGEFGGTFTDFAALIHPDDRESVLATVSEAVQLGADFTVQYRTVWSDNTVRWLSGAGRVQLDDGGHPVRAVGISMDVTERRILEEQFQQAQKMEAIGRLAGGVAHDFNNLLTAILGYCDLLLIDLDAGDPRHQDIEEIQKAGTSAAGLTRQLLAFSRKQIIEPALVDLNEVLTHMRPLLERLIGEDVKILVGLHPELALVMADRGQVEQIIMNLAVNSRDAMPKGGTLTIETAHIDVSEHYAHTHLSGKPGRYVVLSVTDTGTGMTPQVKARLFEPFFTTKELGKGTGFGLAIVHGIVARSGGSVTVHTELGVGTSFKVYLPIVNAEEPIVEMQAVARSHAAGETVLLVEDEDGLRELTKRLLERLGYTVLIAANADEALELFEHNRTIDVLLTDVVMPGASGPELSTRLVKQRPTLKVIYMSGYTEEAIVQHGVLNPAIAFLNKPFTSEALGRKIREVLDN